MNSREPLGALSSSEDTLTETQRDLKARIEGEHYEASHMAGWFRREALPKFSVAERDIIEEYADWRAKEALARDRLERMGFLS